MSTVPRVPPTSYSPGGRFSASFRRDPEGEREALPVDTSLSGWEKDKNSSSPPSRCALQLLRFICRLGEHSFWWWWGSAVTLDLVPPRLTVDSTKLTCASFDWTDTKWRSLLITCHRSRMKTKHSSRNGKWLYFFQKKKTEKQSSE